MPNGVRPWGNPDEHQANIPGICIIWTWINCFRTSKQRNKCMHYLLGEGDQSVTLLDTHTAQIKVHWPIACNAYYLGGRHRKNCCKPGCRGKAWCRMDVVLPKDTDGEWRNPCRTYKWHTRLSYIELIHVVILKHNKGLLGLACFSLTSRPSFFFSASVFRSPKGSISVPASCPLHKSSTFQGYLLYMLLLYKKQA
jgi:hypothetical protein